MEMPNLSDGDVISACISKDFFMKAPDESSIMKDFPENATEWIAADGKRCTDVGDNRGQNCHHTHSPSSSRANKRRIKMIRSLWITTVL
jgi:hypothetical protein